MISVLLFLSLAPAQCDYANHECQAARYIELAREDRDHASRVQRLYMAHREYLYLFDATHKREALCRARNVLSEALALKPTPSQLVERFRKSGDDTTAREHKAGIDCAPRKKSASTNERRLASKPRVDRQDAKSETQTPAPTIAAVTEADAVEPSAPAEAPPPFLPVAASVPVAVPGRVASIADPAPDDLAPVAARSTGPTRMPPALPRQDREHTRSRGLVIAGGMTLSVGLALTGAAGNMGGRLLDTWRDSQALHDEAGPFGTEDQAAKDAALASDYQRLRAPTLAMAIVGGSTLIVGAVLVGIGAKRLVRVASRTALLPMPGGLAFRARF